MAADRLRVLICLEALGVGGKERQAVELIKGLARKSDIECHVVCLATHTFYLDQLAGLDISVDFTPRRVRWDVGVFHKLYQTIREYRPPLIHASRLPSSYYTTPLARSRSMPSDHWTNIH